MCFEMGSGRLRVMVVSAVVCYYHYYYHHLLAGEMHVASGNDAERECSVFIRMITMQSHSQCTVTMCT